MRRISALAPLFFLAACAVTPAEVPPAGVARGPVEVQILALNDFHGNLEPPSQTVPAEAGAVPAGGAAYLASALKKVRMSSHSIIEPSWFPQTPEIL